MSTPHHSDKFTCKCCRPKTIKTPSKPINECGPAFPSLYPRSDEDGRLGMSLRDYFSAKALQGLVTNGAGNDMGVAHFAALSYVYADAMIRERQTK